MAKSLRDIASKDKRLEGSNKSTTSSLKTGDIPAVDYASKSKGDRDFVASHSIEKHDDYNGNPEDGVYKAKTKYSVDSNKKLGRSISGDMKVNEDLQIDEVIKASTPASDVIHDFVHSSDPKFKGKSKKERIRMALGAKYGMMRKAGKLKEDLDYDGGASMVKAELIALADKTNELVSKMPDSMHVEPWVQAKIAMAKAGVSSVHDYMIYGDHDKNEAVEPMLEGGKKKRMREQSPTMPIQVPRGAAVPNTYTNLKFDTPANI